MALREDLGLPAVERVVFERPPLVLIICQLRFAPILSVTDPRFVAPFQQAIRKDYPILTRVTEMRTSLGVQPDADLSGDSFAHIWRFADRSDGWTVSLTVDSLAIECRRYRHFDDFLARLRRLLDALVEHIEPAAGLRLGLRYINEIRAADLSPLDAIRPELLGPLAVPVLAERARLSIQELQLQFSENRALHLRHGLLAEGTTVEPKKGEATPGGPFYLLDMDAFQSYESPDTLIMETEAVCETVVEFHDAIEAMFRWSVTDAFTRSMGVRDHD